MSKVLGVWADIADESCEWHETKYIPDVTQRIAARAYHFESAENAFPEVHQLGAPFFTLYDLSEPTKPQSAVEKSLPTGSLRDVPEDASLEARHYTCQVEAKAEGFSGDYADIGCLIMINIEPSKSAHDAFFEWWRSEFEPMIQKSPEFLRTRLLKLDHASDFREQSHQSVKNEDLLTYVVVYEFTSPDLPWEIMVQIGQSEGWQRCVEQELQYKYGIYHLRKIYSKSGEVEAEFNDSSSDEDDDV